MSSAFELSRLGFWLHKLGWFNGLKVKKPAEKICVPSFLDFKWSEEEVAVEATAQFGSLLLINFTEHLFIFFTCLLTEKGRGILNSPCSSVFTCWRKLGFEVPSLHSTATEASANKIPQNISSHKSQQIETINNKQNMLN